jgi:hypothetical protein
METPANTTTTASGLLATQWPFIATALLACATAWAFQALMKQTPLSKLPLIGTEIGDAEKRRVAYMRGAKQLYLDGYKKASCHNHSGRVYELDLLTFKGYSSRMAFSGSLQQEVGFPSSSRRLNRGVLTPTNHQVCLQNPMSLQSTLDS